MKKKANPPVICFREAEAITGENEKMANSPVIRFLGAWPITGENEKMANSPVICFSEAGLITGENEKMANSPVINQLDFSVNAGAQTNWLDSKKNLSEGVLEFVKNRRILFRFHCDD